MRIRAVGLGETIMKAWGKCYALDTVSIFGGIIACNKPVDEMFATQLSKIFLEIIIAPAFTTDAKHILQQKRISDFLLCHLSVSAHKKALSDSRHCISIFGGDMLIQNYDDDGHVTEKQGTCVTKRTNTIANAIVITKNEATLGIGAGQMNRVGAASIAIEHVQKKNNGLKKLNGSVMASDAFFPMPADTVILAAEHQIALIIQPGGSMRDTDSIGACDARGIAMVFTVSVTFYIKYHFIYNRI